MVVTTAPAFLRCPWPWLDAVHDDLGGDDGEPVQHLCVDGTVVKGMALLNSAYLLEEWVGSFPQHGRSFPKDERFFP